MMFTIGEEQFETLREFDTALRALNYPHTVRVSAEQAAVLACICTAHSDEEGAFMLVGLSRVRTYCGGILDTMDNPNWRKVE